MKKGYFFNTFDYDYYMQKKMHSQQLGISSLLYANCERTLSANGTYNKIFDIEHFFELENPIMKEELPDNYYQIILHPEILKLSQTFFPIFYDEVVKKEDLKETVSYLKQQIRKLCNNINIFLYHRDQLLNFKSDEDDEQVDIDICNCMKKVTKTRHDSLGIYKDYTLNNSERNLIISERKLISITSIGFINYKSLYEFLNSIMESKTEYYDGGRFYKDAVACKKVRKECWERDKTDLTWKQNYESITELVDDFDEAIDTINSCGNFTKENLRPLYNIIKNKVEQENVLDAFVKKVLDKKIGITEVDVYENFTEMF